MKGFFFEPKKPRESAWYAETGDFLLDQLFINSFFVGQAIYSAYQTGVPKDGVGAFGLDTRSL